MDKLTMSVTELSKRMGLSKPKIYELLNKDNGIPNIRVGKRILIPNNAFDEWLRQASIK